MSKGHNIEWEIKTQGHKVKINKCSMGHTVCSFKWEIHLGRIVRLSKVIDAKWNILSWEIKTNGNNAGSYKHRMGHHVGRVIKTKGHISCNVKSNKHYVYGVKCRKIQFYFFSFHWYNSSSNSADIFIKRIFVFDVLFWSKFFLLSQSMFFFIRLNVPFGVNFFDVLSVDIFHIYIFLCMATSVPIL